MVGESAPARLYTVHSIHQRANLLRQLFVELRNNPSFQKFRLGNTSASAPWGHSKRSAWTSMSTSRPGEMASFPGYPLGREFPETFPKMWSFDSSHVLARPEYVEVEQAGSGGKCKQYMVPTQCFTTWPRIEHTYAAIYHMPLKNTPWVMSLLAPRLNGGKGTHWHWWRLWPWLPRLLVAPMVLLMRSNATTPACRVYPPR